MATCAKDALAWRAHIWEPAWMVPEGAERRAVGQVEVAHLVEGDAEVDGGSGDVDSLGDPGVPVPEELHAQQSAGSPVGGEPHVDTAAAGVAGLVVLGLPGEGDGGEPGGMSILVAQPSAGRDVAEDAATRVPRLPANKRLPAAAFSPATRPCRQPVAPSGR